MISDSEIDLIKHTAGLAAATPAPPPRLREDDGLVLYAVIRASSKYAHQGREGGHVVAMRVTWIEKGEYAFHLENANRYRREDLTFYTKYEGQFIKLR